MIAMRRPVRWMGCGFAATAALLALGACTHERGAGPDDGRIATSVAVALPATILRVGDTLRANASASDSTGHVLTGRSGVATISAVVDGTRGTVQVQVVRPPAVTVRIAPDSIAIAASVSVDLVAVPRDVAGQIVLGVAPDWVSTAPNVAVVGPTGQVTGMSVGRAEILATIDGITARAVVVVTRPSHVAVTTVTPGQLTPGATVTIAGSGFSTNRTANAVSIGGVAAVVRSATPTQLTATVASAGYPCDATRNVTVNVTVAGESGALPTTLQVAPQYTLGLGQSLVLADPAQARCAELSPAAGRFVVAVYNAASSAAAVPFTLRGTGSGAPPFTPTRLSFSRAAASGALHALGPRDPASSGDRDAITISRSLVRTAAAPQRGGAVRSLAVAQAIGDSVTVKVLGIAARSCNDATSDVRARTVYIGRKVTVLEDVAAPLAGTMDDDYRRIGQEFDDVTYPLLEANFGNPLAVDSRLSRSGRVTLLFTRSINDRPATLGLTLSCDLVPASVARASNETAIVYLAVPTSAASGVGDGRFTGTRDAWRRRIRSVAAHEAKHLASYAERIARAAQFEEPWLEEGSALVSEEIFARAVRALPLRANTTYRESLACELRPNDPGCADVPITFSDHFARLYRVLSDPGSLTPLVSDPAIDPTAAFYGASWWLLRWSADQTATSDAPFFRALVAGPQTGIDNVVARTGRSWGDLLGDWWLATAVDDMAGFTPQRDALTEPSWNLRDVFAGAQTSGDPRFARAFPLSSRALSFGDFIDDVSTGVRGGGAVFFEISGPSAARQLLDLRPFPGAAAPPPPLSLAIVRVP
jgi:hypothetical protein